MPATVQIAELLKEMATLARELIAIEKAQVATRPFVPSELESKVVRAIGRGNVPLKTVQSACKPHNEDSVKRSIRMLKAIGAVVHGSNGYALTPEYGYLLDVDDDEAA